nr:DIL and ankyrin domain-containing protein [Cryptococcus depauperatus CBS 7841]
MSEDFPTPTFAVPFTLQYHSPSYSSQSSPTLTRTLTLGAAVATTVGELGRSETPHVLQQAVMAGHGVPESPVINKDMGMVSPGCIGESSTQNYKTHPEPRFLNDPTPQTIYPLLEDEEQGGEEDGSRTALVLRHALYWGIERGDIDLVNWLVSLKDKWRRILDKQVETLEDDGGWGLVGMAIQCSCGRQEKEEVVRAIVQRWGVNVGPRNGRDPNGWTPLHLSVLLSTPPLISFLLSHGASPHLLTNRGLTPLDLVSGIPDREVIVLFLEHAMSTPHPSTHITPKTDLFQLPHARQKMLERRRRKATQKLRAMEGEEQRLRMEKEREIWIKDRVKVVEVPLEFILPEAQFDRRKKDVDFEIGWHKFELDWSGEEQEDCEDDSEDNIKNLDFNSNMLVFSLNSLPEIFDILISEYQPVSQPLSKRTLPANVMFYFARYALYMCDESWLEILVEGVIERVEDGIYNNIENLAYLAFWAYNSSVLLFYLQADQELQTSCDDLGLLTMLEELINAIHVFIIRIAERRIDAVLDLAILDYETLEDFNDVRFEGEWSLFRSFVPKKKREMPKVNSIFHGSPSGGTKDLSSSPINSGLRTPNRPQSMSDLNLVASGRPITHESITNSMMSTSMIEAEICGPAKITEILTGVLVVLRLYDVNPGLIVQAFSQIYFWIACELFNRILTRRKYLYRLKAVQIRMNITLLDDWVRSNGLPPKTSIQHLAPVTQLLQWLQCLSQVKEFDTLIGTMQNMRAINPLQMRRAVREYRYEVNEGRMTEECAQYLAQLQKDWEKRRVQASLREAEQRKSESSDRSEQSHRSGISRASAMSGVSGSSEAEATPIDALFDGSISLGNFTPHSAPESIGELLDSRYMLPFYLPSENVYLIATPPVDAAYTNLHLPSSPFVSDTPSKRPLSRASFSSCKPMGYRIPNISKLRELPLDFFRWMKEKEIELKLSRDALKRERKMTTGHSHPLSPHDKVKLAVNTVIRSPLADKTNLTPTLPLTTASNRRKSGGYLSPIEAAEISTDVNLFYPTTPSRQDPGLSSPGIGPSVTVDELNEKQLTRKPFQYIKEVDDSECLRNESSRSRQQLEREGSADSVFSIGSRPCGFDTPPLVSPGIPEDTGKKRWWKIGGKYDTPSPDSPKSGRVRRDASEDTIGPGNGWLPGEGGEPKTPEATTAAISKGFWR